MRKPKKTGEIALGIIIADDDPLDKRHLQEHPCKQFDVLRATKIEEDRGKHSIGSSVGAGSLPDDFGISSHGREPAEMLAPRTALGFTKRTMEKERKKCHGYTVYSIPSFYEIWHTDTMNIVSISWVRNEADVIEAFVRHHCAFLDRMIIIDNRSMDNTSDILKKLQQEGLPLDLRYDDSFAHLQGEALTAVLQELRNEAQGLAIPLDADEFLWADAGKSVRAELEKLPQHLPSLVPWRTYVPMPEDDPLEQNILLRIQHRKTCEKPQWCKVIIPGAVLQKNVKIPMGSHALIDADSDRNAEHSNADSLFLGHFPVRSPEQIAGKVFGGWLSQVANPLRERGAIFQWKAIFDELKSGKDIDAKSLMRLALDYGTQKQWQALPPEEKGLSNLGNVSDAQPDATEVEDVVTLDPIPADFELHYHTRRLPPLQIIAESAEYLAQEVADLRSGCGENLRPSTQSV